MIIAYLESILVASKMEQEHLTIVAQVATGTSRLKLIKLKKYLCFLSTSSRIPGHSYISSPKKG